MHAGYIFQVYFRYCMHRYLSGLGLGKDHILGRSPFGRFARVLSVTKKIYKYIHNIYIICNLVHSCYVLHVRPTWSSFLSLSIHTHTHIRVYIYMCVCYSPLPRKRRYSRFDGQIRYYNTRGIQPQRKRERERKQQNPHSYRLHIIMPCILQFRSSGDPTNLLRPQLVLVFISFSDALSGHSTALVVE